MTVGLLYNRAGSIEIAKHDVNEKPENGGYFKYLPGVEITNLRFSFNAVKTNKKEPNTATLHIFNLNENSRALVQESPLFVRINAGYEGDVKQVFSGDKIFSRSIRTTTGWDTEILIGDGNRSYRHSRLNRSYRPGVDTKTIIKDITKSMGLKVPRNISDAVDLAGQYTSGHAVNGPSEKELTKILKKNGYGWHIQDGTLQARKYRGVSSTDAILISQVTGMIGTPELGQPGDKGEPPVLSVRTLMNGDIKPDSLISMDARVIKGSYKVEKVEIVGDTRGADWYTSVEAIPL